VEDEAGRAFGGCNIESASYGLTVCAERTALFRAVAEGAGAIRRVVVVTDAERITPPCGACRQVLWDLCGDAEIILVNLAKGERQTFPMSDLFPHPFDAKSLD
jgi:cytidine deaminase